MGSRVGVAVTIRGGFGGKEMGEGELKQQAVEVREYWKNKFDKDRNWSTLVIPLRVLDEARREIMDNFGCLPKLQTVLLKWFGSGEEKG